MLTNILIGAICFASGFILCEVVLLHDMRMYERGRWKK
jgi:hypothetical protein